MVTGFYRYIPTLVYLCPPKRLHKERIKYIFMWPYAHFNISSLIFHRALQPSVCLSVCHSFMHRAFYFIFNLLTCRSRNSRSSSRIFIIYCVCCVDVIRDLLFFIFFRRSFPRRN